MCSPAPVWNPPWTSGDNLVSSRTCKRISAPVPGALPPPPPSLTWISAELFLSYIFTALLQLLLCTVWVFPVLKYIITKTLPKSLICGQQWVPLGATKTVFVGYRGSFWCLLTESTPAAALLSKSCHVNLKQYTRNMGWKKTICLKISRAIGEHTPSDKTELF